MKKEKIFDLVKNEVLNNYDLIPIIKDINMYNGALEEIDFLDMEYFNEIMYDYDPIEIVNMVFYGGKFNPNDMYFQFNGYGNLESFNDWEANKEAKMYIDEIVEALIDNIYYIETDEDLIKFIINLLESEE